MAEGHDRNMMDNLNWWGIPTFFRCPNAQASENEIALVGVPHSTGNGTTESDQHPGPLAVRNVSAMQRCIHDALLHLDAHTDVFTKVDHFLGAKKSAAHWGAYLADQGRVDPGRSMQIGLRGHPRTLDWLEPSYEYGYNVVTMAEYRERGAEDVSAQIKNVLSASL